MRKKTEDRRQKTEVKKRKLEQGEGFDKANSLQGHSVFCLLSSVFFLLIIFCSFTSPRQASSQDEALAIRRIVELWKAQDYATAVGQIREFSEHYPQSQFLDSFLVLQGDLDWKDRRYHEALHAYDSIESEELRRQVLPHRLDALYYTKNYKELASTLQEWATTASTSNDQNTRWLFYYAECLAKADEKDSWQQAANFYTRLLTTSYKTQALLGLATVYIKLEKPQEAADIYVKMADSFPDKREALLFKAAQIQATYDKDLALRTYSTLQQGESSSALAASFGEILLLFQSEQYETLIKLASELETTLPKDQLPLLDFFVGRSEFALGNYSEAILNLHPLLDNKDKANERAILTTLIASAQRLGKLQDVETWVTQFQNNFPHDEQNPKMRLLLALTYKEAGQPDKALTTLSALLREYPGFDDVQTVYMEEGLLLAQQERWPESRKALLTFVERYPDSPNTSAALKTVLQGTIRQLNTIENGSPASEDLRQQLSSDIKRILKAEGSTAESDEARYIHLLAKTYAELGEHDKTVDHLKDLLKRFPNDKDQYQTYLLLAYCCYHDTGDYATFITYAEKALSEKQVFPERTQTHIDLFTAYLKQAKDGDSQEKAAVHLYEAISEGGNVSPESRLWLANYLYSQIASHHNELHTMVLTSEDKEQATKAASLFEDTLIKADVTPANETMLYRLSNLYGWLDDTDKQTQLLKQLVTAYHDQPNLAWNCGPKAQFALATVFLEADDKAQALDLYKTILASKKKANDSEVRANAALQETRLVIEALPTADLYPENPIVKHALEVLDELQAKRVLAQEPVHLEAAIERAQLLGTLTPAGSQDEEVIRALKQSKRDFTVQDDVQARDYHKSRLANPDQDTLYQAYVILMDARIAQLEAKAAERQGHRPEANQKNDAAKGLYKTLVSGKFAASKYLVDQAQSFLRE